MSGQTEPTSNPADDPVGTVRRLRGSWYVKLSRPAEEPWHVACSDGPQRYSGWQDNETMADCPVVGYLPITECAEHDVRDAASSPLPAPRVFLVGDTVPVDTWVINDKRSVFVGLSGDWEVCFGPCVELRGIATIDEFRALVDRAASARAIPEPTEGQNHG